ncbi:MAG: DNA mismatch repair endonuclease MutL, partial [Candidatus Entotheonellia bacterium]
IEDLGCITSFGFRGEALPSIASVSRLTLTTCAQAGDVGTWLELEGGVIRQVRDWAGPVGTAIEVRHLFFNTPARLKFLKSRHTELGHILTVVSQLALAHPTIRFRLTHETQVLLDLPPMPTIHERLATIWGAEVVRQLMPIQGQEGSLIVHGFISPPTWSRASRDAQYLFVNTRMVRDRLVLHALYEAYRHVLPEKRHPMAFVFITLPPQDIDVNVHPHKTEVRFAQSDLVHAVVKDAIQRGLSQIVAIGPTAPRAEPTTVPTTSRSAAHPDWSAGSFNQEKESVRPIASPQSEGLLFDRSLTQVPHEGTPLQPTARVPARELRPLGQIHYSFIVADGPEGLYLFDQHALQERILYEVLKAGFQASGVARQHLLFPAPVELTPAALAWFEEYRETLERLGFEAEPFGGGTVVLRTVPAILAEHPYIQIYRDVLSDLSATGRMGPYDEIVEEMLASMACHD